MANYILIDDEAGADGAAEVYCKAIASVTDGLEIKAIAPLPMPDMIEAITSAKPDGILLDVELLNVPPVDGKTLGFNGIALAQQIRTLQTRGLTKGDPMLPEFPIVRFSNANVISEYVSGDSTSNDLFDEMVDKAKVDADAKNIGIRLRSLADDYAGTGALSDGKATDTELAKVLGCSIEFLDRLDPRILLGLRRPGQATPAHVLARYFTARLLKRPGALITEELLAVRFGVDRPNSPRWVDLLKAVSESSAYRGLFHSGFPRWWNQVALDWWAETIDPERAPYRLTAAERVEALATRTGMDGLSPITDNPLSPGLRFWHHCIESGLPVDPAYGYALLPTFEQETWQDAEYLCEEEALRNRENPRLGLADRARLDALLAKKKQRQ